MDVIKLNPGVISLRFMEEVKKRAVQQPASRVPLRLVRGSEDTRELAEAPSQSA